MYSLLLQGEEVKLRSPGVAAVGAPLIDLIGHVDEAFVARTGYVKGASTPIDPATMTRLLGQFRAPLKRAVGGGALNVAFALAKLSGRVAFVGKLGIDYEGWLCRMQMREAGITAWLLVDDELPTGKVLCMVTPDAERTMLASLGASVNLRADELSELAFHKMGITHFEGYQIGNMALCKRTMAMAKGQGSLVSLDLASMTWVKLHLESFRYLIDHWVDILFGNYEEMCILTALSDPVEICRTLGKTLKWVFLTRGVKGVWCYVNGEVHHFPVTPIVPLDTTGAGDFFCAGVLHALRWNWPLDKGVELAAALAAEVIQVDGAKLPDEAWLRIDERFDELLHPERMPKEKPKASASSEKASGLVNLLNGGS